MLNRNVVYSINENFERLKKLNEQLSTGRRVNTVSDDAIAAMQILRLRRENEQSETNLRNIESVDTMLSFAAGSLQRASEAIARIKELAVQAATGTYTDANRLSMAEGVDYLLSELVTLANVQTKGAHIFSGEATDTPPFLVTTDASGEIQAVTYQGEMISTELYVGPDMTSEINLVGKKIFQDSGDLFETVIRLRDAIRTGDHDEINGLIGDLDVSHVDVTRSLGGIGEKQSQLQAFRTMVERFAGLNAQIMSELEDADIAELSVQYNSQMVLLQMVMKVAAQVVSPSLIAFL